MPTPGLSLVGFMEEQPAISYLVNACVPPDPDPAALHATWQAAHDKLGEPIEGAGSPAVEPIPDEHAAYLQGLQAAPLIAPFLADGWQFSLVSINELLAFQCHVDSAWSDSRCAALPGELDLAHAVQLCLPSNPPQIPIKVNSDQRSAMIRADGLNLRVAAAGLFQAHGIIGVQLIQATDCVLVAKHNDRCYLKNGFHRTCGLAQRGLESVPCLFREVATFQDVCEQNGPFSQELLESANPPTVGHFVQGRATEVALRRFTRVVHMSWADYQLPDD